MKKLSKRSSTLMHGRDERASKKTDDSVDVVLVLEVDSWKIVRSKSTRCWTKTIINVVNPRILIPGTSFPKGERKCQP